MFTFSSFSFQLDSYEVEMKFHLLSFATEAIDIVDIRESQISGMTENVIAYLMEFDYHSRTPLAFPSFSRRTCCLTTRSPAE